MLASEGHSDDGGRPSSTRAVRFLTVHPPLRLRRRRIGTSVPKRNLKPGVNGPSTGCLGDICGGTHGEGSDEKEDGVDERLLSTPTTTLSKQEKREVAARTRLQACHSRTEAFVQENARGRRMEWARAFLSQTWSTGWGRAYQSPLDWDANVGAKNHMPQQPVQMDDVSRRLVRHMYVNGMRMNQAISRRRPAVQWTNSLCAHYR